MIQAIFGITRIPGETQNKHQDDQSRPSIHYGLPTQ